MDKQTFCFVNEPLHWSHTLHEISPVSSLHCLANKAVKRKLHQQHFIETAGEPVPRVGKRKEGSECVSDYGSQQESRRTLGTFLKE